jgi:hypothetical protein
MKKIALWVLEATLMQLWVMPMAIAQPSAPPVRCEIKLSAWCIAEGAAEIRRELSTDSVHDRNWMLRGQFNSSPSLVVMEPNGCRDVRSDALTMIAYDESVQWDSKTWDRIHVRMRKDGRCDIQIYLLRDKDPYDWAFSSGLNLIRRCQTEVCHDLSVGQLKSQFGARFHRD